MSRAETRQDRLRTPLRKEGVDALLVTNPRNVCYLTGFSGDSSYLLLGQTRSVLVSDRRYTAQIEQECPGLEVFARKTTGESMAGAVAKVAGRMRVRRLAYESTSVTVSELAEFGQRLRRTELVGWRGQVESLRARKDAEEIRMIREAIRFAEQAFVELRPRVCAGDTEKQLADELDALVRRRGARKSAFETIVAVGPHAVEAHARPGCEPVRERQPVLVDWGARGSLYNSDLTRMMVIRRIPAKLQAVYEVVLKAQQRAIQAIRPGIRAKAVDAEARTTIEQSGFGRFFNHGTGHGIGLEVHEAPALRPNSETVLQPGMVVTVEPGIYLPGWGGVRIEDDVLITRDGHEVLSTLPKDLDSILLSEESA